MRRPSVFSRARGERRFGGAVCVSGCYSRRNIPNFMSWFIVTKSSRSFPSVKARERRSGTTDTSAEQQTEGAPGRAADDHDPARARAAETERPRNESTLTLKKRSATTNPDGPTDEERPGLRSRFRTGGPKLGAPRGAGGKRVPSVQRSRGEGPRGETGATSTRSESVAVGDGAEQGVRLSKLMASRGLCSRREADGFIERGWVVVDGVRVSELGTRVDPDVCIELAPEASRRQAAQITILLHKPVGYVSGQPEPGYEPAVSLIGADNQFDRATAQRFHPSQLKGLAPAGRLDIDSTGLLVLTQNGRIARTLIGEDSKVDKEYIVRVEGRLSDDGLALLNHGLELDGRKLRRARVEWINEDQLRFVLREGRKRQIRRMCELVGLRVIGLKRVRIGGVRLGDLPLGQWRYLREDESFEKVGEDRRDPSRDFDRLGEASRKVDGRGSMSPRAREERVRGSAPNSATSSPDSRGGRKPAGDRRFPGARGASDRRGRG